jgi:hypothetical protein
VTSGLLTAFLALWTRMSMAFRDPRPRGRVENLALGLLCAEGPKTITSALFWLDQQYQEWSNEYRLLSHAQWTTQDLFAPILESAVGWGGNSHGPIFAAHDDTLLRKTGRHIPGVCYARDPTSPPFHVNLVLGQRFLQTSVLIKAEGPKRMWRSIPVGFEHAPPLKARPRATAEERAVIKEARKKHNMSQVASEQIHKLREAIDRLPQGYDRMIVDAVDGSFANRTFLRGLPERTVVVARIRKNAKLRTFLPKDQRKGPRKYGERLPTPEQILKDESIPWLSLDVFVAQKVHRLKFKVVENVCWPKATLDKPLRLIVIKPAGYRLRKGSKLLYRQPAYLIGTSTDLLVEVMINAYLARWEVEVNFHDEKSVLGVGEAQVWNPLSVNRTPAFLVAAYAALLIAQMQAFDDRRTPAFDPLPAWRKDHPLRPSLRDLIALLRKEAGEYVAHKKLAPAA